MDHGAQVMREIGPLILLMILLNIFSQDLVLSGFYRKINYESLG